MIKKIWFLSLIMLGLSSCTPSVNYLGRSYPATNQLDLYFSYMDIPSDYEIMGHAEVRLWTGTSMQASQKALEKYAKEKGADGIVFHDINTIPNPTVTTTKQSSRNNQGGYDVTSTTTSDENSISIIKASLIKYK